MTLSFAPVVSAGAAVVSFFPSARCRVVAIYFNAGTSTGGAIGLFARAFDGEGMQWGLWSTPIYVGSGNTPNLTLSALGDAVVDAGGEVASGCIPFDLWLERNERLDVSITNLTAPINPMSVRIRVLTD